MRFLLVTLLIALASGCASNPVETPPVLIHDYCSKDKPLWFDRDTTITYLEAYEPGFLVDFTKHNTKLETLCPEEAE